MYFCAAIGPDDNELITLEIIHRYVELLDKYFGSVSESIGQTDGMMDGGMDRLMDGWMDRWTNGWMDGWIDGWMDGWTDRRMDG